MEIKKVSNPLTIIAIFAMLAEIACTGALVALTEDVQRIFVWFVMGFPTLLVLIFFVTLWIKPSCLYAPSDYDDEHNFLEAIGVSQGLYNSIEILKKDLETLEDKLKGLNFGNNPDISDKLVDIQAEIDQFKAQADITKSSLESLQTKNIKVRLPQETIAKLNNSLQKRAEKDGKSISELMSEILQKMN